MRRPHLPIFALALCGWPLGVLAQRAPRVVESHGFRIERSELYVDGVHVVEAERVVRRAPDGHVDWQRGPAISEEQARQALGVSAGEWRDSEAPARALAVRGRRGAYSDDAERVLFRDAGVLRAAWRVSVRGIGVAEDVVVRVPSLTIARIEARTDTALGEVYLRNPESDGGRTVRVSLPPQRAPEALANAFFDVRSCDVQSDGSCLDVRRAMPDAQGDFLLTPDASSFDDGFAEVSAFHHLSELADRFERDHGFRYACPLGGPIDVHVNYTLLPREPYANAAFVSGSSRRCASFVFGQASTFDFAYDADVLHHELAHLVTAETAGLVGFAFDAQGAHFESLALNEGTSDYWAAVMQGDGVIGESVRAIGLTDRAQTIREIGDVYTCPDSLEGSGHLDGRIWSSAMWALRGELGPKVDALVYLTVASLSRAATFAEAAEVAVVTARSLVDREGFTQGFTQGDAARVEEVLEARGLRQCRRVVRMRPEETHVFYSGLAGSTGSGGARLAPIQIVVASPHAAERIRFAWRRLGAHGRYILHRRAGAPVEVRERSILSDEQVELAQPTVTFARLESCRDTYFALETLDLSAGSSFVALTLSSVEGGAECSMDAGGTDAGRGTPNRARGGGCNAGGRAGSAPMFTLLVGFLLGIGRRSRRGI